MTLTLNKIKPKIKEVFKGERVVCRVLAAWCVVVASFLFTYNNFYELSFLQEKSLLSICLYIVLGFIVLSMVSIFLSKFHIDSYVLMLGSTVCVVKWLVDFRGSEVNEKVFALAVVIIYALFVIYFLKANRWILKSKEGKVATANKKPPIGPRKGEIISLVLMIVLGVAMATVISIITCMRYKTFSAPNYDFGIFCNMFHYMKETGLPFVTCERDELLSHFAVHISPIYYLLLPFYYVFPSPLTLQIGQAVILASGIVPVYLLCRKFRISNLFTILISIIYACYPATTSGTFYDIHENCFLLPLLLWMFYFYEKKKYIPMYIFAVLVLAVKEDAAVYVALFGIYVFASEKKYIHGSILTVGSILYFILAIYLLRKFGTGAMINRFNNLIYDSDDGLFGALKTAIINPGFLLSQLFSTRDGNYAKVIYVIKMFLPLGFIPFCAKKTSRWLLLVPILMNLLTQYPYQYEIVYQYHFGITAFLFYAMIINSGELKLPTKVAFIGISVIISCSMYLEMIIPKITYYCDAYSANKETYQKMEEILDEIPKESSLCISTMFLPHVADRDIIYEVHYHDCVPDTEYVVIDMRPGIKEANEIFIAPYLEQGYSVIAEHEDMMTILKQN